MPLTKLAHTIVSGDCPLAPRPATRLEKYQAIAQRLGIAWEASTPIQLERTLSTVRFTLSAALTAPQEQP